MGKKNFKKLTQQNYDIGLCSSAFLKSHFRLYIILIHLSNFSSELSV